MASDFWSKRKAKVAEEQRVDTALEREAEVAEQHKALEDKTDAEICEHFGLPDPDTLKPGDKIVAFMRDEIPEHIKRRAMRKLWTSNPVLACLDGLNDYDDDYTNLVTDMPGVPTSYQVGKGLTAHVEELERQKTADLAETVAEEIEPEVETALADEALDTDAPSANVDEPEIAVTQPDTTDAAQDDDMIIVARPRRMQFAFEEDTV